MLVLVGVFACSTPEYKPLVANDGGGASSSSGSSGTGDDGGPIAMLDGGGPTDPPKGNLEVFLAGIADPNKPGSTLGLREIAVDFDNVYVVAHAYVGAGIKGYLLKTPRNAPTQTTTLHTSNGEMAGLAIDAQLAYVYAESKIVQVPLSGGGGSEYYACNGNCPPSPSPGYPIAANAGTVFWLGIDGINGRDKEGGPATVRRAVSLGGAADKAFVADFMHLYWFDSRGIVRAPVGVGDPEVLVPATFGPLANDNASRVYFVRRGATQLEIRAFLKQGGPNAIETPIAFPYDNVNEPLFLAADDQYVWWTSTTGRIVRAKPR